MDLLNRVAATQGYAAADVNLILAEQRRTLVRASLAALRPRL